jgi:hypothetical protein
VKKTLLIVFLSTLCNLTLFAQNAEGPRVKHFAEKSVVYVARQEAPAGLKVIYTNLGSKTDIYNASWGWEISGPNSGITSEFIGLPFTPKSNAQVSEVRAALQYSSGANQVDLSLYSDTNGAPGTLLAGPVTVTNLPGPNACCTLMVADFPPLSVDAGTRYWIVGDTPLTGTGSDFSGGWQWVSKDIGQWATNYGDTGWSQFPDDGLPAGEVLGTVP